MFLVKKTLREYYQIEPARIFREVYKEVKRGNFFAIDERWEERLTKAWEERMSKEKNWRFVFYPRGRNFVNNVYCFNSYTIRVIKFSPYYPPKDAFFEYFEDEFKRITKEDFGGSWERELFFVLAMFGDMEDIKNFADQYRKKLDREIEGTLLFEELPLLEGSGYFNESEEERAL